MKLILLAELIKIQLYVPIYKIYKVNVSVFVKIPLFYISRYSIAKAFCIAFVMTFFPAFDVPVFWPILLCYWIVLFVLTMKRQIAHMIKHKYIPFSVGKQVGLALYLQLFVLYLCVFLLLGVLHDHEASFTFLLTR